MLVSLLMSQHLRRACGEGLDHGGPDFGYPGVVRGRRLGFIPASLLQCDTAGWITKNLDMLQHAARQ